MDSMDSGYLCERCATESGNANTGPRCTAGQSAAHGRLTEVYPPAGQGDVPLQQESIQCHEEIQVQITKVHGCATAHWLIGLVDVIH